ncbi:FAD-dependent oxidoreductase [Umezawaea endophytica]|uniref:FAD-dependent oxidoreductase n=1 Tax=Umezawaea endophytica TaxID=1654476 RepID=A0A9X2VKZ2_9PSEU|nr:FAD-dependent oxidoreductase [Umezawaea endophytica]MCS7478578.1 FAD-dependent oxidoreductase [Umezawaea endophytica]
MRDLVGFDVDVVVVGGGAMGSAAAWQLAARGADVLLLERFAHGHTRGASHGASRIFRVSYTEPVYIGLAHEALAWWRELEAGTGRELLTLTGGVAHGRTARLEHLARALDEADNPGTWLPLAEAAERWPGLRFDGRVFFHPVAGRLHADHSVTALQEAAVELGATVRHETPVTGISVHGDQHVEVRTDGTTLHARRAVVAVGAWSSKLLGDLVRLPPLRVTQEQPAHFRPRDQGFAWPSFTHDLDTDTGYPSGVYGLATPGEGVKAGFHGTGPVVDPDTRSYRPEPDQLLALRRYARDWLPGVDPDDFDPISCTYTTTTTSNFVLDRVGPLVVAAGFSGHGFKFTPAIGRALADLTLTADAPNPLFAL